MESGNRPEGFITLVSVDGHKVKVMEGSSEYSSFLMGVLDQYPDTMEITVPKMFGNTATQKIGMFLNFHRAKEVKGANLFAKDMQEWRKNFFQFASNESQENAQVLLQITLAAESLQIEILPDRKEEESEDNINLLDLCAHRIAESLKGKSTNDMRRLFGIKNDFTPPEEREARERNRYCSFDDPPSVMV